MQVIVIANGEVGVGMLGNYIQELIVAADGQRYTGAAGTTAIIQGVVNRSALLKCKLTRFVWFMGIAYIEHTNRVLRGVGGE